MVRRALINNIGDIDLRLLRLFRTVARCGGLAASEFELNIGRSTISKHLSDLETRMALKLCYRGRAGFSLTVEGEKLLEETDKLLLYIDSFQNSVDDIHRNLAGTLRVALFDQSATNPEAQVFQSIRAFDRIAPDVNINMAIEPPNVIEAGVIKGEINVGIIPVHRKSPVLTYCDLYTEQMVLYCGHGHPLFDRPTKSLSLDDLAQYKYAGFGFNSPNMMVGQRMNFRRSAQVQDEEALSVLILSGCYLGFLPDHVAKTFVRNNRMRAIDQPDTKYRTILSAISRKRPEPSRREAEFLKCLKKSHGIM